MKIVVIGDEGRLERTITHSANLFETSEAAIGHGKALALEWIRMYS